MSQTTSPRKGQERKAFFLFLGLVLLSSFTLQSMAVAQESKGGHQILFLGRPFKYLYHQVMSDHLTLWFYVPSGESVTPGKEVISLWQFSTDFSLIDVVRSSQEAIKKGRGEILTQGGATSREYFAALLNPCASGRCIEIMLQRFWQEPDGIRGIYYSKELSGLGKGEAVQSEALGPLHQWLDEIRRLKTPEPWKHPPPSDASLIRDYVKAFTKEGLALAAEGAPLALKYLNEALALAPEDPFAYLTLGLGAAMVARKAEAVEKGGGLEQSRLAEKLWNEALRRFEAQGKNEGPRSQCLYLLGDLYEHVFGDPRKAAEFYARALQLNPKHPAARRGGERIKGKNF